MLTMGHRNEPVMLLNVNVWEQSSSAQSKQGKYPIRSLVVVAADDLAETSEAEEAGELMKELEVREGVKLRQQPDESLQRCRHVIGQV